MKGDGLMAVNNIRSTVPVNHLLSSNTKMDIEQAWAYLFLKLSLREVMNYFKCQLQEIPEPRTDRGGWKVSLQRFAPFQTDF